MAPDQAQPDTRIAIWFFRIIGPALLASGVIVHFVMDDARSRYDLFVGPLHLVAWVGSFLVFLDYRRTHPKLAVPFALTVLVILLLAVASLFAIFPDAMPSLHFDVGYVARIVQLLAALALTVIGWTTRLPSRQ